MDITIGVSAGSDSSHVTVSGTITFNPRTELIGEIVVDIGTLEEGDADTSDVKDGILHYTCKDMDISWMTGVWAISVTVYGGEGEGDFLGFATMSYDFGN